MLHTPGPGHLADVNQALDARFEFYEGAVIGDVDHAADHPAVHRIALRHGLPGVRRQLFQPQGDALLLPVEFQHLDGHFVAHVDDFRGMTNAAEGHVGDMQQTVDAAQVHEYGAFVDLGGIDGLLHVTDMSFGRVGHPSEIVHVGDEVTVKVLKFDRQKERVSLGLKQLAPDPWETVAERYPMNGRVIGRVVNVTDYGAFVELEPGVEGLIHISEMTWSRRMKHPSKVVKPGDQVEAVVLDVHSKDRRISLGLKQLEPNPWTTIDSRYSVGSVVE